MRKAKKQTQLKTLAAAISLIAIPLISFNSYAAGLGRITVQSALGQPLRAQLEIMANKDEVSSVVAQLASPDAFRLAGVDYTAALTGLKFSRTIKEDGARKYIEVSTDRPLNEPFIDMLVELSWASGRLVREYTFLLDPPDIATREVPAATPVVSSDVKPGSIAASDPVVSGAMDAGVASVKATPIAGEPAAKVLSQKKVMPVAVASNGQERQTRSGDTLGKIAREVQTEGISLDQMLVALFRENPDAFEGNMNRLRTGKILRIPDAATAGQIAPSDARKEVVAQSSDWEAYRARVAARAALAKGKDVSAAQGVQGKVAPKVEEIVPAAKSASDKLAVSRTETGKEAGKDGQKGRVGALEEDLVARDRALKDANGRIADLEKNLNDLKKLAELKSQSGVNAQKMADSAKAPPVAPAAIPVAPAKPAEASKTAELSKPADSGKSVEAPPAVVATPAPAPAAEAKPEATPAPASAPAPETPKAAAEAPAASPKPVVKPVPEPEPEPDFMEENGLLVAGGGGVLALLFGYLGFSAYRRKKASAQPAGDAAPMTEPSAAVNSVFSDTVSATVAPTTVDNVGQTSVLETVGGGADASIDPLDEADTYLAFGKDSQAEEILLDALKQTPTRWPIHLKLLEIYSARRNAKQFKTLAEDLHQQTGAAGSEWQRAAELGRSLDPNNPLYMEASAEAAEEADSPKVEAPMDMESTMVFSAPPVAESAPVVTELSEEKAAVLDFDLGLDDTPEQAVAPAAPAIPSTGSAAALDFDMDLDAPVSSAAVAAHAPVETAPAGLNIDFDLDLPATPKPETATPVASEVEALSMDSGLSLPEVGVSSDAAPTIELSAQTLQLDVPDISLPVATPEVSIATPEAAPDFDFDMGEPAAPLEAPEPSSVSEVDLPLDPNDNPEAATKLELALAYEEMGDRDGARELFQEVLAEGSETQKAMAQAKLDQLG